MSARIPASLIGHEMLRSQPAVDEVNFGQPGGGRQFKRSRNYG